MAIEIGSKGLVEVDLILPQSTSLSFTVVHKDDQGNIIDHSESVANMAFQTRDKQTTWDLDSCCTCSEEGVSVTVPSDISASLPTGKLVWDLIVDMGEEQTRLCYGTVVVVDTYAMDGA